MGLCNSSANCSAAESEGRRFYLISLLAAPLPVDVLSKEFINLRSKPSLIPNMFRIFSNIK